MKCTYIEATTLPDAWFQTIYSCLEHCNDFVIDEGSYKGQKRLEFDYITIRIKYPDSQPFLPKVPEHYNIPDPVDQSYINGYLPYLMTGDKVDGEAYTYGERICRSKITKEVEHNLYCTDLVKGDEGIWTNSEIIEKSDKQKWLSQLELLIWTYKNKGHRNNQMIMQVGQPTDMLLIDPPCLRHIDTRIQDGKLHFFPYFRSWDLYGGFPANLAAIELMKQYCAEAIGVENGEIVASSKGLHLYDYTWELTEILRGKTIEQFRTGK